MTDSPVSNRRWLRFSLRTMLLLVTALGLVLGYAVNWKHKRQAFLNESRFVIASFRYDNQMAFDNVWPPPELPWMLRIVGETPVFLIMLNRTANAELQPAEQLFPEAEVLVAPDATPIKHLAPFVQLIF